MKARQKLRLAGPTTGCCPKQAPCSDEKQRVRQPAVRDTQKNKQKKEQICTYTHTNMNVGMYARMRSESESELGHQLSAILRKSNNQTYILVCLCMYVCMRSESESASHSSPPQHKVCEWSLHVHARACVFRHYFANLTTLSVCLPVHTLTRTHTDTQATLKTQANTCQEMIKNQHFHACTASQYSATRNTLSPKRWKPGKNAVWQGRQLVVVQNKIPVSRRNRGMIVWGARANQR